MDKKEKLAEELTQTPADEKAESPEEQAKEEKEGTEIHDSEGVIVPEKFQQAVHEVLKEATTKHHLSHMRDRIYAKEDDMRKEEMKKQNKGKSKSKPSVPEEFSAVDMPA